MLKKHQKQEKVQAESMAESMAEDRGQMPDFLNLYPNLIPDDRDPRPENAHPSQSAGLRLAFES
jgi:hypothetical protein